MENDFIPYGSQDISEADIDEVVKVLKSPYITQGPLVELFEKTISEKVNSKYTISTNSATSALHIACLALDLKKGDILWTSPNTFVASANCGLYCGASVDFIDINPKTGLISINYLREKLAEAKRKNKLPKILIPVHLSGTSCEMKEIFELKEKYGFSIIEDASHALGGKYENQYIGNCKYSDITVFSFHPVKIITTGEGGAATTNKKDLSLKMQKLRTHGITKKSSEFLGNCKGDWYYEQHYLGFNYRITDIQAALGISQMKRLDEFIARRNEIRKFYTKELNNLPLSTLEIKENILSSCHLFVIRLKNKSEEYHKNVFQRLRKENIGVQLHYLPVHLHPFFRNLGFQEGDFPESEHYSKNSISLPIYPKLSHSKQRRVIDCLRKIL